MRDTFNYSINYDDQFYPQIERVAHHGISLAQARREVAQFARAKRDHWAARMQFFYWHRRRQWLHPACWPRVLIALGVSHEL